VIGLATGAAMAGMRPLVEMAYIDFIGVCFNALANFAAKTHYMSGGQYSVRWCSLREPVAVTAMLRSIRNAYIHCWLICRV